MNDEQQIVQLTIYSLSAFVFALPEMPEIEVTVEYTKTHDETISAEAWLYAPERRTMRFLADIAEFEDNGFSESEIENKLVETFNKSEVFADSVAALISENYDYFNVDTENVEQNGG